MKQSVHPVVQFIKNKITKSQLTYKDIAQMSGIKPGRLRNIFCGRVPLTLEERDMICCQLKIEPLHIMLQQTGYSAKSGLIDISELPEAVQEALRILIKAVK